MSDAPFGLAADSGGERHEGEDSQSTPPSPRVRAGVGAAARAPELSGSGDAAARGRPGARRWARDRARRRERGSRALPSRARSAALLRPAPAATARPPPSAVRDVGDPGRIPHGAQRPRAHPARREPGALRLPGRGLLHAPRRHGGPWTRHQAEGAGDPPHGARKLDRAGRDGGRHRTLVRLRLAGGALSRDRRASAEPSPGDC